MYSSGGKCLWMSCVVSFFSAMGLYRFIVHSWLSQKQQPEYFGLAELLNFWMFDSCWIHALVVWYVLSIDFSCNSPHKDVRIVEGMWKDAEEGGENGRKTWTEWLMDQEVEMEGKRGLMEGILRRSTTPFSPFSLYFCLSSGRKYWDSLGGLQHSCTLQTWTIAWLPGYMGSRASEPLLLTSHGAHNGICL